MTLQRLREERAMTQKFVAGFLGTTEATVSRWENGQAEPRPVHQRLLAELYKISIQEVQAAIRATLEANSKTA